MSVAGVKKWSGILGSAALACGAAYYGYLEIEIARHTDRQVDGRQHVSEYSNKNGVVNVHGNVSGKNNFVGDTYVTGDILDGAVIIMREGGLLVKGNIGNNVTIRQAASVKSASDEPSFEMRMYGKERERITGVTIEGSAGRSLVVISGESLSIGDVGENLMVKIAGNASLGDIGAYGQVISGGNVKAKNLAAAVEVKAKLDATVGLVGPGANVVAVEGVAQTGTRSTKAVVTDANVEKTVLEK